MEESFLVDSNTLIYASQALSGSIVRWINLHQPYVTDISEFECLSNWSRIQLESTKPEKRFLDDFFMFTRLSSRFIETDWLMKSGPYHVRALELQAEGVKERDSFIAAAAEARSLALVTADRRKNFAPRLQKLNSIGQGKFKLRTYDYVNRELVFASWI